MAGITKNFVIKNGLEVNGGLFIVNTDNNKVGVGTSVLVHDFNVKGGIGVTNIVVTGIATVGQFISSFSQLGVATASVYRVGTTTVFETNGSGLLSLSGIQTINATAKTTLNSALLGGQVDIANLTITGVATFSNRVAIGGSLDVDGQGEFDDINVSGVSTFVGVSTYQNTLFGTRLSVSGVSTLSSAIVGSAVTITSGGINVTGIVTATSARIGAATTIANGGINLTGIATIRNINSTQITSTNVNVTGVSSFSSAIVGSAVTITSGGINVTGIVTSTEFDVTGTTNTFNSGGLSVSGVVTSSSAIVGSAVTISSGGINLTGIATIRNINSTQITSTNVNVTGVSSFSSAIVGSAVTITSGGINATGVSTFATYVRVTNVDLGGGLFAGIITAANAGQSVKYFGDGSNLTGVNAAPNLGISTQGGFVGSGVTLLNFRGSGVSTVFTNFTAGIGTIFIEGGTVTPGGSNTQVQFNNAGVLGGSSNFTFDGTGATIGTSRFNGSGIRAGIITGTSFSGSGSGITGLTNSNLSGSAGITNANLANSTISGISLGGTLGTLTLATSGTGLSGSASYTGASGQTFTVTSNAASANTASAIVARDAGGGFVAGIITAGTFSGNVVGNINSTGISTISSLIVGSATTITGGGVNAVGVVSATSFTTKGTGSYQIGGTTVITSGRVVQYATLQGYAEKRYAFGNTGTAPTLDLSNGNFVTATLTGNATWVFSLGSVPTGDTVAFTLHLTNDATAGRTITWPASVVWPNGVVPTRTTTANRTDVYTFYTFNSGSTWYGNLSIYNYS
jgi:hypothetical protein